MSLHDEGADEGATNAQVLATGLMTTLQASAKKIRESRAALECMATTPDGSQRLQAHLRELRHWIAALQPALRELNSAAEVVDKALRKASRFRA